MKQEYIDKVQALYPDLRMPSEWSRVELPKHCDPQSTCFAGPAMRKADSGFEMAILLMVVIDPTNNAIAITSYAAFDDKEIELNEHRPTQSDND